MVSTPFLAQAVICCMLVLYIYLEQNTCLPVSHVKHPFTKLGSFDLAKKTCDIKIFTLIFPFYDERRVEYKTS